MPKLNRDIQIASFSHHPNGWEELGHFVSKIYEGYSLCLDDYIINAINSAVFEAKAIECEKWHLIDLKHIRDNEVGDYFEVIKVRLVPDEKDITF